MSDFSIGNLLDDDKRASLQSFSENLPPKDAPRSKKDIVSRVAYLIGVGAKYFGLTADSAINPQFSRSVYYELDSDKEARIVRNLCRLRTKLQRNFKAICIEMNSDVKNIDAIPDLIPPEILRSLEDDGVSLVRPRKRPEDYSIDIHNYLLPHVPNCQKFIPTWVKWQYIRSLFFFPRGNTTDGNREAAKLYHERRDLLPYHSFINWQTDERDGNILRDDAKFLPILYDRNRDKFYDMSKVTDAGDSAVDDPTEFFAQARRVLVAVDCENADPCKVMGVMKELVRRNLSRKIAKVILVDDEHTPPQWRALRRNVNLPLEYLMTDRVKGEKSAVDVAMTIKFYREISRAKTEGCPIDSAIIVSSDCDFWPLIELTPEVRFMVMLEYDNCSQAYYHRLQDNDVPFLYIDEYFGLGNLELKTEAVLQEVLREIEEGYLSKINIFSLMNRALTKLDLKMNDTEAANFFERFISPLSITFAKNGGAVLQNKPTFRD